MNRFSPLNLFADTGTRRFALGLAGVWTALLCLSLAWNCYQVEKSMVESARIQARSNYIKDVVYRRWNSIHGGVYAPITDWTPPNPYLGETPERDIQTPSGQRLTKVNPAYMTRQAFELGREEYGLFGHITSLNPIRPENAPDPWETDALRAFEANVDEVQTLETIDGRSYLRLMRPLVVEQSCLKCHAHQGYRLNDIRGGISVAVPMQPFQLIAGARKIHLAWGHLILWLAGIAGIGFGANRIDRSQSKRYAAEVALRESYADLEHQVEARTSELQLANKALQEEILERRRTARALAKSTLRLKTAAQAANVEKKRFQALIDESPYAIALIDQHQLFGYLNPRFEAVFGYTLDDITTRYDWFERAYPDPDYRQKVMASWRQAEEHANPGMIRNQTWQVRCKDGSDKWVQISTAFLATGEKIVTYEDVTEQHHMEERLRQAQKMEAIGTLAGGIAHDFNNILSAILGYAELVKEDAAPGSAMVDYTAEVIRAGLRARNLVEHILDFSRQSKPGKGPLALHLVIKETLSLLKATIPATILIHQEITPSGMILGDSNQMHQVVMNLCTNACQAMQMKAGQLGIMLKSIVLDTEEAAQYTDLTPGRYLQLSVSDTGCGMTPDIIRRIFDPYFTTKPQGEGTGLGLSVIHGIVKNHGGAITVYSEPGKGSTFHVYLPLIKSVKALKKEGPEPSLPTGSERILLVDDEPTLTELGKKMLSGLGYHVQTRSNGSEALALLRRSPREFDLLITDMTMPHMSGVELAGEVMVIRPDLPIILCTGFSHAISGAKTNLRGIREVVMKPVIRSEIAVLVRRVLDEKEKVAVPHA